MIASSSAPAVDNQPPGEDTARQNLQRAIAAYVSSRREDAATPERMLVDLKSVLSDVTGALEPEMRRAVFDEIVGLAIEEYYREPTPP